jgi:hypothetical protein
MRRKSPQPMNLPRPATHSNDHLVADWVELAAATHANGIISGEALVDAREEQDEHRGHAPSPTKTDARQREAEDIWRVLRARAAHYGEDYPFEVADDAMAIQTLRLTAQRVPYAFLLAASNLSAFAETDRHLLTTGFERASRHALAGMLPANSTVSIFGTSSHESERYGQRRLIDRLRALAADLATQLTREAEREADNGKERSSGDGGLDLVGWPELTGPRKRLPVYFGQCACGTDWYDKPHDVSPVTWNTRMEIVSPIVPVTFIPYAYRTNQNDWRDLFKVVQTVLIDRPRWIDLLSQSGRLEEALADIPTRWMLDTLPGLSAEPHDLIPAGPGDT